MDYDVCSKIFVFQHRFNEKKSTWSEKGRTKPTVAGKTHLLVSTVKIYNNVARLYWVLVIYIFPISQIAQPGKPVFHKP